MMVIKKYISISVTLDKTYKRMEEDKCDNYRITIITFKYRKGAFSFYYF